MSDSDHVVGAEPFVEISATSIKLPQFTASEPLAWFRRAEAAFFLKKITASQTKAEWVVSLLPETALRRMNDWLDDQPPKLDYDALKTEMLRVFSLCPSERAQRVLAMSSEGLGDRTVRDVWHQIQALCKLPEKGPDGRPKEIDLKKEILLQIIPPAVVHAIPYVDSMPISDLVEAADSLLIHHKRKKQTFSMVADAGDRGGLAMTQRGPSRSVSSRFRPPPKKAVGSLNEFGICTYHTRFGEAAKNCVEGCKWTPPKNAAAGPRE
jgi:hypothetical protein